MDQARYGTLAVLADGVGGRPGGQAASRAAVQYLQALYYAPAGPDEIGPRLRECIQAVNTLNRANGSEGEGLTTLVAAVACNEHLYIANVGDSSAFLIQASTGRAQRLTEDHSEFLPRAAGEMPPPEPEAATRRRPRGLTRAIGLEENCQVDSYAYTWLPGDRVVLCSDGLDALGEAELVELTSGAAPMMAARRLVETAMPIGRGDDTTVVVLSHETPGAARTPARARGRAAARPPGRQLGLVAALAVVFGVLLGWLSAAVAFIYLAGLI